MIYAGKKINRMPEFYMIFAPKNIISRIWGWGGSASFAPRLLCLCCYVQCSCVSSLCDVCK